MPKNKNLLKASYNGAEFFVSTATVNFGRRGVMHQSPFSDSPFYEDLGRRGRTITIDAYIVSGSGEGSQAYEGRRDALIAAIENSSSAGTLVHPTMGSLQVVPTNCSTTFNNTEGRIEKLTITFAEEGSKGAGGRSSAASASSANQTYGGTSEGYEDVLALDYNIFGGSSGVIFRDRHTVEKYKGAPAVKDSFLKGLTKKLKKFLKFIDDKAKTINTDTKLSSFSKDFLELSSLIATTPQLIVGSTSETFTSVKRIMFGFSLIAVNPLDRLKSALSMFGAFFGDAESDKRNFDSVSGQSSTSQKYRQRESELAFTTLLLSMAITEVADATLATEFTDVGEITTYKEQINESFNQMVLFIGDSDSPDTYEDLIYLQSQLNIYLNEQIEKLPEAKTITNVKVRPALVITYNEYGDSERTEEFITRNGISNPNLVEVGEVEVLV
jgi:hypothetical protein